ncbi:MAG: HAD-IC family P-type ATPase [Candidatus Izemoplasmatales bacterium]|nr:HAD-IC family P-type ATPase [Candidatus Izemoplasmatales bacterium]
MAKEKAVNGGLTIEEVNQRFLDGKVNRKPASNLKSVGKIISDNLFSYFNLILALLAILLISIRSFENMFFVVIALMNTLIGIIQELKARSTVKELSLLSQPMASVIRQHFELEIPIEELVVDDLYCLKAGNQIVTDSDIAEGVLIVNEANLTGEAEPVVKKPGDRVYSGSFVVSGNAFTRVKLVGKDNFIEQLSAKVKTLGKPTSVMLRSMKKILKVIGIIIIPLGLMTFFTAFTKSGYDYLPDFFQAGEPYQNALKKMAGSMVAMVPSGMFLLTTFTFATGVIKLSKKNVLVQELYSIETLSRIDMVCLDKTGTLTDGSMRVSGVESIQTDTIETALFDQKKLEQIISSMNYALKETNPTGMALSKYFGKKRKFFSKKTLAFSSQNKYSAVCFDFGIFAIGAPEMVLKGKYMSIKKQVEAFARKGKRVLLFAQAEKISEEKISGKVVPIALILLDDHVRESALSTLNDFHTSGVDIKIISGDNHLTVADVAERAGVPNANKAISLANLSDEKILEVASQYTVFGRVRPDQKKLLITHFQKLGRKVAMVGDGVNDILALKAADCSIAMANGSDAARNISHLVLLDSDFSSMPQIVKNGRQIVNNMERASVLYLVKTVYTILLTIIMLLTANIYPFEPVQMFVIETFIISFPSVVIALEPNNKLFHGHFLRNVFRQVIPGAILIVLNLLAVYGFARFWPSITSGEISTVGIIAATFAYLLVLVNISTPLNRLRSIVIMSAGFISAFCFIVLGERFFKLVPLSVPSILLLLLLMESTYILMSVAKRELVKFWA